VGAKLQSISALKRKLQNLKEKAPRHAAPSAKVEKDKSKYERSTKHRRDLEEGD